MPLAQTGALAGGRSVRWAAVGLLLHVTLVGALLASGHGPAWFLHLGRRGPTAPLAHRVLGPNVAMPQFDGHDGQQFWVLARDPFLLHARQVAPYLDHPSFRADRILYPLAVAPWRLFGESTLLWALFLTNVVVAGIGTWMAASLARDCGTPERAGLAFALCPGVLAATTLDTADGLALALVLLFLLLVRRRQWSLAVVAAVAAVLTREASWLAVAGAVALWRLPRKQQIALLVPPSAALACWSIYVRVRLGWASGGSVGDLTWPFFGYLKILTGHTQALTDLGGQLIAVALLILSAMVGWLWWRRRTLLLSTALPFALLMPFLGPYVLGTATNSLRAAAPLLTLVVLELYRPGKTEAAPSATWETRLDVRSSYLPSVGGAGDGSLAQPATKLRPTVQNLGTRTDSQECL